MNRTVIVYSTKYGVTRDIAYKLGRVLGPAVVITPAEFDARYKEYDSIVIGTPIYAECPLPEIQDFVSNHFEWMKAKPVGLFCVSLLPTVVYLQGLRDILGDCVVWTGCFGGLMDPASLSTQDSAAISRFSEISGASIEYTDCRDDAILSDQALILRRILKNTRDIDENALKNRMEKFLYSHNTCSLCTGHKGEVRATPIEYTYWGGALYFITEGGEKLAHLLVNPAVSVAVYDAYQGFSRLSGLQITGMAQIVNPKSDEYESVLRLKGLQKELLHRLPATLYVLKVEITHSEFLLSDFISEGHAARQSLDW